MLFFAHGVLVNLKWFQHSWFENELKCFLCKGSIAYFCGKNTHRRNADLSEHRRSTIVCFWSQSAAFVILLWCEKRGGRCVRRALVAWNAITFPPKTITLLHPQGWAFQKGFITLGWLCFCFSNASLSAQRAVIFNSFWFICFLETVPKMFPNAARARI